MTIHVEKARDGFVVSIDPDPLAELWRSALARNPDALLTLDDLRGIGQ